MKAESKEYEKLAASQCNKKNRGKRERKGWCFSSSDNNDSISISLLSRASCWIKQTRKGQRKEANNISFSLSVGHRWSLDAQGWETIHSAPKTPATPTFRCRILNIHTNKSAKAKRDVCAWNICLALLWSKSKVQGFPRFSKSPNMCQCPSGQDWHTGDSFLSDGELYALLLFEANSSCGFWFL